MIKHRKITLDKECGLLDTGGELVGVYNRVIYVRLYKDDFLSNYIDAKWCKIECNHTMNMLSVSFANTKDDTHELTNMVYDVETSNKAKMLLESIVWDLYINKGLSILENGRIFNLFNEYLEDTKQ